MSLVKDPNVQLVRVRQDLFALAIMSNFFPDKMVVPKPTK